ncbi:MAG: hypothetical protein R2932_48175 [Caldilineaceae bacterium]
MTQRTLTLNGPAGLTFSAEVLNGTTAASAGAEPETTAIVTTGVASSVDGLRATHAPQIIWPSAVSWLTASSANVLPAAMTLTFAPAALDSRHWCRYSHRNLADHLL